MGFPLDMVSAMRAGLATRRDVKRAVRAVQRLAPKLDADTDQQVDAYTAVCDLADAVWHRDARIFADDIGSCVEHAWMAASKVDREQMNEWARTFLKRPSLT